MITFGFIVVYSFAIYGAWTVGCKVRDWLYGDDNADVTPTALVPFAHSETTGNSYHVPPRRADYGATEVQAKRQTRKASPKTPSSKIARKRSTKSGK